MTISVVFEFPTSSVDDYRRVFEIGGTPVQQQPGRLHHQCFQNGDGFTVIDLWESEAAFAAFGQVLGPILQQLGLVTAPKVHRTYRTVSQGGTLTDH